MANDRKKILVTGSSGLIGRPLYERLVAEGHEVVGVDNNSRFPERVPPYATNELGLVEYLSLAKNDFDVIYHMAAINGTSNFYSRPNEVAQNNIACDMALIQFALQNCATKLVYASSSELVAGTGTIPSPEESTVTIEDIHNPRWSYRLPKIVAENYLVNSSIDYVIVRYFNVYSELSGAGHFVRDVADKVKDRRFEVDSPYETRSFCYVDDAIDATIRLADTQSKQIFNVGSDEELRVIDAANVIATALGESSVNWVTHSSKPGSSKRRCPDLTKTKTVLKNFSPRTFGEVIEEIKDKL